jgi:poly(3-hydroxybutyrate) depolymerase
MMNWISFTIVATLVALASTQAATEEATDSDVVTIASTVDGVEQPALFIPAGSAEARPLLVVLHTWSSHFDSFDSAKPWQAEAAARDWHLIQPEFRGPNNRPEACASNLARQDIIDAVAYAQAHAKVDDSKIYLAGGSGGGHMALVMATHAPDLWAAVTAWVPITDLAAWHAETKAAGLKYWKDVEAVCGGSPGASPEVDAEYRARSPLYFMADAKDVPLDINAGIHDGHEGSVPIHHAIDAFNAVAEARERKPVKDKLTAKLSRRDASLRPKNLDASYGRAIYLRREAGPSRLTIFEGGHEMLPEPACEWLARH